MSDVLDWLQSSAPPRDPKAASHEVGPKNYAKLLRFATSQNAASNQPKPTSSAADFEIINMAKVIVENIEIKNPKDKFTSPISAQVTIHCLQHLSDRELTRP